MTNALTPKANHNMRPRLVELINGMTDDQCQELFEKMQGTVPGDKRQRWRTGDSKERNKERRAVPRVDIQCPVYIHGISDQKTITDLSIEGAFVECDSACKNKFSSGELITLTIKPGTEDDMIRVQAQIVSFSDWGMHCKFAHLDRKITAAINHWVSTA